MKKKALSLVLALVLALSMAACGNNASSGTDNNQDTSETSSQTVDSSQASETQSEESGAEEETAEESDLAYVQDKGTLVVGITYFDPMDYKEEGSDEWIGFDADMAKAFAESLGVDVEFIEITWDYKVEELDSKSIDAVWNGMTLTDGVQNAMTCTPAYCRNAQVVVVPAA